MFDRCKIGSPAPPMPVVTGKLQNAQSREHGPESHWTALRPSHAGKAVDRAG